MKSAASCTSFADDEEFNPIPYVFTVRDLYGKRVSLPFSQAGNAKVVCPSFHVLFDHLVAVLWNVYSNKNTDHINVAQIQWAISFLEGTKDRFNSLTEDIEMAIEDLWEFLMEVVGKSSETSLHSENEANAETGGPSRYEDFIHSVQVTSSKEIFPSITLNDMYHNEHSQTFKDLLAKSNENEDRNSLNPLKKSYSEPFSQTDNDTKLTTPANPELAGSWARIMAWKSEKIQQMIDLLVKCKSLMIHSKLPRAADVENLEQLEDLLEDKNCID